MSPGSQKYFGQKSATPPVARASECLSIKTFVKSLKHLHQYDDLLFYVNNIFKH